MCQVIFSRSIYTVFKIIICLLANAFTNEQKRFQKETLTSHNQLRARNCAPALELDDALSKTAQAYAEYLAANNKFEHSKNGHGENLYMMSSSASLTNLAGSKNNYLKWKYSHFDFCLGDKATQSWYNEIKDYDFNKPGFSGKVGHFTQVVWKNSKKLGVGIAFANDGRKAVVVANYSPPGNYLGQFPQQVLPATC